ncbi:hypothetical protein GCM10028824_09890 [Hymenobacter segetis]
MGEKQTAANQQQTRANRADIKAGVGSISHKEKGGKVAQAALSPLVRGGQGGGASILQPRRELGIYFAAGASGGTGTRGVEGADKRSRRVSTIVNVYI